MLLFSGAMGYDHIIIPQPENAAGAAGPGTSKFCGSTLAIATAADMTADKLAATVCSKSVPFNIRYVYFYVFIHTYTIDNRQAQGYMNT